MKFNYPNQAKQARKWIVANKIKTLEEIAEMSDSDIETILEEYAKINDLFFIVCDDGETIGLVPKGCVWFER